MALPVITQNDLPKGWILDGEDWGAQVYLKAPDERGYLTLNLELRAWDFGSCRVHFKTGRPTFKGRGWHLALLAAAIKDFDTQF